MKTRRSTAILLTVWIATFVVYLFVRPATPAGQHAPAFSPVANIIPKSQNTPAPAK
ncbi:hypothetical protein GZH49_28700 [Nocardia terpenica]|uniref:hypothetical protein n=1 Tax=Nocardia terpenica TaxID=455432 RepID=UPI0026C15306